MVTRFCAALTAMLIAVAAVPASAQPAPDWRRFGETRGSALEWDAANVERGETLIVTVRLTRPAGNRYPYTISRIELRCMPAQLRTLETANYLPDGSVGSRDTVPVAWDDIPPDSLVAGLRAAVC